MRPLVENRGRAGVVVARVISPVAVAMAILGSGTALVGCGQDATPAHTTTEGRAVYDPDHTALDLTTGASVIIQMPPPDAGGEWRLFTAPDDMACVSLGGMQRPDGSGRWTFEATGPGSGTLDFQQWAPGSDEPSGSVAYEVNVK